MNCELANLSILFSRSNRIIGGSGYRIKSLQENVLHSFGIKLISLPNHHPLINILEFVKTCTYSTIRPKSNAAYGVRLISQQNYRRVQLALYILKNQFLCRRQRHLLTNTLLFLIIPRRREGNRG